MEETLPLSDFKTSDDAGLDALHRERPAGVDPGLPSEDELDKLIHENLAPQGGYLEEWHVLTLIFKAFIGTGILGLPSAVMHGGLILGPLILMFIGFICMYNIKLLVDTAKHLRENLSMQFTDYSSISEHVFTIYGKRTGKLARYCTDMLLCTLQVGFCCVYVVFIAHNLQAVAGILNVRVWMMIILPFLLAITITSNIRLLAYFTTFGNTIALVGLGIIYQYLFTNLRDPRKLPKTNGFVNACVSFGQIVYAFEGIAVVLPIENKLRSRDSFSWLMKIASSFIVLFYASIGVLGYMTFGEETLGSITLNLPNTKLYQVLQFAFSLMVYVTYPLQLLVSIEIIKSYFLSRKEILENQHKWQEMLLRSLLVTFTCILAIFIPQLDNFMALVGCVSGVAVAFILPPTLHALCYKNQGISSLRYTLDILIIVFGIFATILGTSSTIYSIMHRYIHFPDSTDPG